MVPKARDIVPGTGVNIVLKAEQPTGRLTTGVVRDVLTRGDHPHGVKVRLTTNQVGRVQSLVSATASAGGQSVGAIDEFKTTEGMLGSDRGRGRGGIARGDGSDGIDKRRGGTGPRQQDQWDSVGRRIQALGLDAFIVSSNRRRHRGSTCAIPGDQGGGAPRQGRDESAADDALVCPICGGFAGDEPAVAHHVAEHFDGGWTQQDGETIATNLASPASGTGYDANSKTLGKEEGSGGA